MTTSKWPEISYFREGTALSREVETKLRFVERKNWRILYQSIDDGSYWRIDEYDKFTTRFLVRLESIESWETFDSMTLEKSLLIQNRGGFTAETCKWLSCDKKALVDSAFCEDHTYEMGVRM